MLPIIALQLLAPIFLNKAAAMAVAEVVLPIPISPPIHVLKALNAKPLLDLSMRLGEASGAATVLPLIRLSCALHNQMATFEQAAVSGKSL